jgi:hypothetical protein
MEFLKKAFSLQAFKLIVRITERNFIKVQVLHGAAMLEEIGFYIPVPACYIQRYFIIGFQSRKNDLIRHYLIQQLVWRPEGGPVISFERNLRLVFRLIFPVNEMKLAFTSHL